MRGERTRGFFEEIFVQNWPGDEERYLRFQELIVAYKQEVFRPDSQYALMVQEFIGDFVLGGRSKKGLHDGVIEWEGSAAVCDAKQVRVAILEAGANGRHCSIEYTDAHVCCSCDPAGQIIAGHDVVRSGDRYLHSIYLLGGETLRIWFQSVRASLG